jgi:hypothetical protein
MRLLDPDVPLIFFSNTLSLCSFLKVRNQVSHPYRHRQHYIVVYSNQMDQRNTMQLEAYIIYIYVLISEFIL